MNSESASEFTKDIREIGKFEVYKLELSGLYLHYVYGESAKFKLFFDLSRTSSYLYSIYRELRVICIRLIGIRLYLYTIYLRFLIYHIPIYFFTTLSQIISSCGFRSAAPAEKNILKNLFKKQAFILKCTKN